MVDARKERIDADAAWTILSSRPLVITARGKKVTEWQTTDTNKEAILKAAMGPSGNLRAPTLRLKDRIVVGFHEDFYKATFAP
ncbi:hypothetical protein SAMN05216233_1149 [Desulfoluna spongiiphila]|uniref:ArsC family protein n=1 Tax=Desulfoluna spongiiphila TaxID=419481 RepID=A0A1G5HG19_9BACT|nr:hypothetical protein SAMN05216233_1149 [Desulfoluna spongiiphila]